MASSECGVNRSFQLQLVPCPYRADNKPPAMPVVMTTDIGLIRYQLKIEINLFYVSTPEESKDLVSRMVLGYLIDFKSSNIDNFQVMYKDPEIKESFTKGQIVKTLWPFIRQLHIDLSNRHNLQVPPLPWIK